MERPPNFKRIVGVVKKVDNNYYGIGDGLGNFAFLTKSFIVGMYPTSPLMWQKTIFLIDNSYNIKWKPENAQYFNSYDYQIKTIPIPEPIPSEFLDSTPPQSIQPASQPQPIPQQPIPQPMHQQPPPMTQQPGYQQPTQTPSVSIPVKGMVQSLPAEQLSQIRESIEGILQILIEHKTLLEAIGTLLGYTNISSASSVMPPSTIPNSIDMGGVINEPVKPEKLDEEPKSDLSKNNVPKINW